MRKESPIVSMQVSSAACLFVLTLLAVPVLARAGDPVGVPLFREFDGRTFTFRGGVRDLLFHQKRRLQPRLREASCESCSGRRYYNLLSEENFQVTTLFKDYKFTDKFTGTFVKGVGMRDGYFSVIVETKSDSSDKMMVIFQGERMDLDLGTVVREVSVGSASATFTMAANVRDLGFTVNLTTYTASLLVYLVPPGLDTWGVWQPSYLNFELTLLKVPSKKVEGLMVADTYRLLGRDTHQLLVGRLRGGAHDDLTGPPDFVWELTDYFAAPRYKSLARLPKAATRAMINLAKAATRVEIPPVPLSCESDRVGAMGEIPCFEDAGPGPDS